MAGRFKVETVFKVIDQTTAPVSRMHKRVGKFTRGMERGLRRIDRRVSRIGAGLKRMAVAATIAGTAIVAVGADIARTGMQFEQSIVNASAKFGESARRGTESFEKLEDAVRDVGRTTEFTASQAGNALDFLAMAGFNAKSSVAALPKVVDLATAAQTDLATATDIATDSLGAFGMATKDPIKLGRNLAKINDLLAKTATTSNTTIEQLFESIKSGAPAALAAGASMETFAASVGIMANSGIKGDAAGTALRNMFLRLASPAADAKKTLRRLNIEIMDSDGNMRDMFDILGDLNRATADMGTAQKAATMDTIFGKRAISAASIVMGAGEAQLKAYRTELENAQGASKEMAEYMRSTTLGSFKTLQSAIESVKITLFDMEKGPLKNTIESMTEWVRANEKLIATKAAAFINEIGKAIAFVVEHRVAIMRTVKVIAALVIGLKILIGVLTVVNLVMAANPITWIVLGIVLLIAALSLAIMKIVQFTKIVIDNWDIVKAFYSDLWDSIVAKFWAGIEAVKSFFSGLWKHVVNGASVIKDVFLGIRDQIVGVFESVVGKVMKVVNKIINTIKTIKSVVGSVFGDDEIEFQDSGTSPDFHSSTNVPMMVPPQERIARSIEERRSIIRSEVTILDDTGRAEVTDGSLGPGLTMLPSGAF